MKILLAALAALVVSVSAAAVDKTKELDAAQDLIINLNKVSTLDRKLAYRCGMFFPDTKDPFALPVAPLLIFNASWPAEECGTSGPDYDKYNDFCGNLFGKFSNTLSLSDPSIRKKNRDKGSTIGNDICGYLKNDIKAPFVGGKSKKFPEGLQIGMFSNACGDAEWQNAEKYHKEKVCCKAGKYVPCEQL